MDWVSLQWNLVILAPFSSKHWIEHFIGSKVKGTIMLKLEDKKMTFDLKYCNQLKLRITNFS